MMREGSATARTGKRAVMALPACLGLLACEIPRAVNPVEIYREVSGANDALRPTPPGLDRPFPNLASVPPRPERPSPEARDAITAALAADRGRSRDALVLRAPPGGGTASAPGMSAVPPARPALAAAPRVPWMEAPPARGLEAPPTRGLEAPAARGAETPPARTPVPRAAAPVPAAVAPPPLPEMPDAAPAAPSSDLGGAPPAPSPDLLAPPPRR